ncbi:hypothetical protein [Rhodopila sp.]|uniref:hypothetical protein n=1 Tax=Rhodopila sp. TaxID=2480087 RepID=UPI003D146D72
MSVKRSSLRARPNPHNPVIVVPPSPLGSAELDIMRNALLDVAPEWTVDLHGFCSDEATLILLPEDGDDAKGPSFVISRENFGFRLDQLHWDEMHEVGIYSALTETVAAIQVRLTFTACQADSPLAMH